MIVRFLDAPAEATEACFQGAFSALEPDGDYRVARFGLGVLRALSPVGPTEHPALALVGSSGQIWAGSRV